MPYPEGSPVAAEVAGLPKATLGVGEDPAGQSVGSDAALSGDPGATVQQHGDQPVGKHNVTLRVLALTIVDLGSVGFRPDEVALHARDLGFEVDVLPAHGDALTSAFPGARIEPHNVREILPHRDPITVSKLEDRQCFVDF
ncbi:hypothetical protein AMK34_18405 [Amycolatopsis sp. CB00013]|nr:hypothetical protein AMK34_18405 [Amycolatopsis sp. CB00013]